MLLDRAATRHSTVISPALSSARRRRSPWSSASRWSWAGLLADEERMIALRDSARALLGSRALVWLAGSATLLTLGFGPVRKAFDPPGVTRGFGWLGDALAGPAARWGSSWDLGIPPYGYPPDPRPFPPPPAPF